MRILLRSQSWVQRARGGPPRGGRLGGRNLVLASSPLRRWRAPCSTYPASARSAQHASHGNVRQLGPSFRQISGDCSAAIRMVAVLPHPGMLPSGSSIASPECSRRHVSLSIDYTGSALRGVTQASFPVRSTSLLSRPDLAMAKPRRAAERIGRSGATRSHAQRAVPREHGEDGEHRTFPEVSTVAHSRRSRIGRQRIHCEA